MFENMKVFLILLLNLFGCYAINEPCTNSTTCLAKEKTVCLNNICSCDTLSYYLPVQQRCVKYATEYGSICYEDEQCVNFLGSNSECYNNVCSCSSGYSWYQGKCQKYAGKGEICDENAICLDQNNPLSLTCDNAICQCTEGYYDRGQDCRLMSKVEGDCAISNDCFPTIDLFTEVSSHCELGICVADAFLDAASNISIRPNGNPSAKAEQLLHFKENDVCADGFLSNFTEAECESCAKTTIFENSTCICNRGYFLQNGKCVAELGMSDSTVKYTSDSDCPIKPGKLIDNICYCKNYWFQSPDNRECKKTTLQFTRNCMDNDWCKAMGPYAFCNNETSKCECDSQSEFNETSFFCKLKANANLTGICLSDSECPLYETCINEQCQCSEGFYRVNQTGLCLPKIFNSCEVRDCSHIENAECSSNEICECKNDDYVTDGVQCLKVVSKLYEDCLINEQCHKLKNAACLPISSKASNGTSQCLCKSDYLDVDGVCYARKTPGSLCSTREECTIILGDSFVCRNMLCQCPIGKRLGNDNVCVTSDSARKRINFVIKIASLLLVLYNISW